MEVYPWEAHGWRYTHGIGSWMEVDPWEARLVTSHCAAAVALHADDTMHSS